MRILLCAALLTACGGRAGSDARAKPPQVPTQHAQAASKPPSAKQRPYLVRGPAGERSDEYYWLRDDTRSSPEVLAHLRAENAYTDAQLQPLEKAREALYAELTGRLAQDDTTVPVRKNGYLYSTRVVAGGEYPIHVRRRDAPEAPEEVLLDGNALAKGHAYYHIGSHEVSSDGKVLAFAEDRVGRGQYTIRFRNLETAQPYPDTIGNAEWSIAFANDHQTLLYIEKHPETLLGFRVRKHKLGTDPAADEVVYEEKDHAFYLAVWKSRSERYLNIYAQSTNASEQWLIRADDPELTPVRLVPRQKDHEYLAEDAGDRFVVRTNYQAPNFRLVEAPASRLTSPQHFRELVPQSESGVLEGFSVFRDFVAYTARVRGQSRVFVRRFADKRAKAVPFEGDTYTARVGDNPEVDTETVRLAYTSLTVPERDYDYHVPLARLSLLKQKPVLGDFREADYVTRTLQAPARDGKTIPVSLAHHRDVRPDGRASLYLMGYGAYGASEDPEFSSARLSLMNRGVVVAIAHVRGGQELGRAWYEHGRLAHKRNTFTDFLDATDFLLKERYAAADKVVARGASAGGLLMGAVANMAPEKYRVIVAHVPFVDVVTTMLDESIPLTSNEYDEWGDPRRPSDYTNMLSYSPYDNVQKQAYPAMFVTTGLWDSQVQYHEPVKWVARLRAHKTDKNPLVLRVNMEAGHGGRSGRFKRHQQLADEYAFVLSQLGLL